MISSNVKYPSRLATLDSRVATFCFNDVRSDVLFATDLFILVTVFCKDDILLVCPFTVVCNVPTVDDIELTKKRAILRRVVNYKNANYLQRWGTLYREFEDKYHIDLNTRFENYNKSHKPKCKNKLDYIDKVMNKIPELYEIAVKLYENDVKALIKEMYYTVKTK